MQNNNDAIHKKTILHVADSLNGGGAEAVFRDTIIATESLGYINHVYVSDGKTSFMSYIYSMKHKRLLLAELKKLKPDILHLQNFYHYLSPSVLAAIKIYKKNHKLHVVFTAHDYHLICPNSGFQYFEGGLRKNISLQRGTFRYLRRYDRRSVAHSLLKTAQHILNYKFLKNHQVIDDIISPSFFLKKVFSLYNIKTNVTVIRNPVGLQDLNTDLKDTVYPSEMVKFVFFGRVTEEKGLFEFLNLLNECFTISCEVHVYGEGTELDKLKCLKFRKEMSIFFHGFQKRDDIPNIISQYDIFILPSLWYENAPISIIEAAKSGLPILVPNYGGLQEMAKLTKYHYFFEYENGITLPHQIFDAYKHRHQNYILDEEPFSMKFYAQELNKIYNLNSPQAQDFGVN